MQKDYRWQLLCYDSFYGGRFKGIGRIYLQAVVDTYGSYEIFLALDDIQHRTTKFDNQNQRLWGAVQPYHYK